jgi:hypothetical protein
MDRNGQRVTKLVQSVRKRWQYSKQSTKTLFPFWFLTEADDSLTGLLEVATGLDECS